MPLIVAHPNALLDMVGTDLGTSAWLLIDQARINAFADVTGDHQWIHVDVARATAGPFGAPIAHGYLTLSLLPLMVPDMIDVRGVANAINIGVDNLRFLSPVRAGSKIRGKGALISAEAPRPGHVQAVIRVTIEIEGSDKPAAVVDSIVRYIAST